MSKLFIIGNGVDIAHGLKTNYCYFYDYLHSDDEPAKIKALKSLDDGWNIRTREDCSDLETKLQYPSNEFKYASDCFNADLSSSQLKDVKEAFISWLNEAYNLNELKRERIFNISPRDFVVDFNYTDTINEVYDVDINNIYYVHGCIINELYGEKIFECPSFNFGIGENCNNKYLMNIRKNTSLNFNKYLSNHKEILNFDEMQIIGLSFSDGDKNFLRKIISEFNGERIKIYFYSDEDKRRIVSAIEGLSINEEKISILDVKEYK